ncbi:unnamed protein product [Pichia kudriavzevii]
MAPSLAEYTPQSVLGYGKFSTVVKASRKGSTVAIKIIRKADTSTINKINNILPSVSSSTDPVTNYDNEINIIREISPFRFQNIIQYYSIYNSSNCVYIIQELSLYGELTPSNFKTQPFFSSSKQSANGIMTQRVVDMVSSICFLHSQSIIHRDIKPANFLLCSNGTVKLTDFDTSYKLGNKKTDKMNLHKKLIGTPLFMPPELLTNSTSEAAFSPTSTLASNSSSNSEPSKFSIITKKLKLFNSKKNDFNPFMLDIWSLGVTLHYLYYSKYPFYADNEFTLLHKIATTSPDTPSLDHQTMLSKLILQCLNKDPSKRPSASTILNDFHKSSPPISKGSSVLSVLNTADDLKIPCDEEVESTTITQKHNFQLPIFMSPPPTINKHFNRSSSSLPVPKQNDNRDSIHTLPANFKSISGSGRLKHSDAMNFKKFLANDESKKQTITMEEYFDNL